MRNKCGRKPKSANGAFSSAHSNPPLRKAGKSGAMKPAENWAPPPGTFHQPASAPLCTGGWACGGGADSSGAMCGLFFRGSVPTREGSATALVLVCSILRNTSREIVREEVLGMRAGECS